MTRLGSSSIDATVDAVWAHFAQHGSAHANFGNAWLTRWVKVSLQRAGDTKPLWRSPLLWLQIACVYSACGFMAQSSINRRIQYAARRLRPAHAQSVQLPLNETEMDMLGVIFGSPEASGRAEMAYATIYRGEEQFTPAASAAVARLAVDEESASLSAFRQQLAESKHKRRLDEEARRAADEAYVRSVRS